MMNMQKVFHYEGAQVRTVVIDGQPWFVAKDVCIVLELKNPSAVIQRLDDDERAKFNLGRQGDTNVVNEPGLYSLILASRKPEAKAFKRWVVHEVLPSIRQTGSYTIHKEKRPDFEGRILPTNYMEALDALVQTEKMRLVLVAKVEADAPKVAAFDTFIDSHGWQTMSEVAKAMDDGRNNTYATLRENGILIKNGMDKNLPIQKYVDSGHFAVKEITFKNPYGQLMSRSRTLVSPKGVELVRRVLSASKRAA
ncbi:phage antirepressor Ant [Heliobacterium undosum]|uniref:Phage antirepressor Ant n=1 Tax=Heliomicrobium undosum TaxID=121734 RepID=A0A845KYP1_9FIRM|nr:phage antirepressor [Heliomicrobium undosum]MZP28673.1 phage antirepressor Ant [Heliomicrobium undosum]